MTWKDLIMFRCHNGVVEEGMLVEWIHRPCRR